MKEAQYADSFSLHFGCKDNAVDSKTLVASLTAFTEIIEQVNEEIGTRKEIEVRVKPFVEGSFDIPFDLIEVAVAGVLSSGNVSHIPEIIKIFVELVKLKLSLKGEEPKQLEEISAGVQVTTNDGNVTVVDKRTINIYQNNTIVDSSFENHFRRLADDETIDDFQLRDKQSRALVSVKREEFKNIVGQPEKELIAETMDRTDSIIENVKLSVYKIVFDNKSKWEFYYRGNKIPAKILDNDFNNRAISGESFANGDMLEVELRINRVFDKIANIFVNKSYEITRVDRHIPREEQLSIGL
ncbi:MAG: hypothetical protein Q8M71_08380 [Thermodesulfovibrionales bacterium]|nr:hypothetical protein [Thermodesulfovibrionales bacterium]